MPETWASLTLLTYHDPWEGSSVSIFQIRKRRLGEASHHLRSRSLQGGSKPWTMSAPELGSKGTSVPA